MNSAKPFKVLFLCTGNSARSVMAEYFLRRLGRGAFEVYSAGAQPKGVVDSLTLKTLREKFHIDASDARSKSWDEFKGVEFDFVITVCDNARESCPIWPGQPIIAHWGLEDPAEVEGSDAVKLAAFERTYMELVQRIRPFVEVALRAAGRGRRAVIAG